MGRTTNVCTLCGDAQSQLQVHATKDHKDRSVSECSDET